MPILWRPDHDTTPTTTTEAILGSAIWIALVALIIWGLVP